MKYIAILIGAAIAYRIAAGDWIVMLLILGGVYLLTMLIMYLTKDTSPTYIEVRQGPAKPRPVRKMSNDRYLIDENPKLRQALENIRNKKLKQ